MKKKASCIHTYVQLGSLETHFPTCDITLEKIVSLQSSLRSVFHSTFNSKYRESYTVESSLYRFHSPPLFLSFISYIFYSYSITVGDSSRKIRRSVHYRPTGNGSNLLVHSTQTRTNWYHRFFILLYSYAVLFPLLMHQDQYYEGTEYGWRERQLSRTPIVWILARLISQHPNEFLLNFREIFLLYNMGQLFVSTDDEAYGGNPSCLACDSCPRIYETLVK